MTIEQCREFINDPKYSDVREYFLSAFKRINRLTDKVINEPNRYSDYDEHPWLNDLMEDIGEVSSGCVELLERAYVD